MKEQHFTKTIILVMVTLILAILTMPNFTSSNETYDYGIVHNLKKIKNFLWWESDESSSLAIYENVEGNLPSVVEMQWIEQRDNQKQTPMGIKLRAQALVKIEVKTKKGTLVKTIVNRLLEKGQHDFVFPHINIKKGTYQLVTTVEGQTKSQYFRVKRTHNSSLFPTSTATHPTIPNTKHSHGKFQIVLFYNFFGDF